MGRGGGVGGVVPTSLKTSVDSLGVMNVAHKSRIPNNEQILQEPSKLRFWGEGCIARMVRLLSYLAKSVL